MNGIRFSIVLAAIFVASAASAATSCVRVKVGVLDGAPVYHWCVFKSAYSDDVDRALVLREFKRRGFTLPEHFVEEQLQRVIAKNVNGDKAAFDEKLKQSGASITKYKQFLAEEITLAAMPRFIAKRSNQPDSPVARAKWIASLRKNAKVTLLQDGCDHAERPNHAMQRTATRYAITFSND